MKTKRRKKEKTEVLWQANKGGKSPGGWLKQVRPTEKLVWKDGTSSN